MDHFACARSPAHSIDRRLSPHFLRFLPFVVPVRALRLTTGSMIILYRESIYLLSVLLSEQ